MAGSGATWVRSLTAYLLRTGALSKYKYLENGAHWATALGVMMQHCQIIPLGIAGMWAAGLLFVSLAVGAVYWRPVIDHQEVAPLHQAEEQLAR